jgi:hypothetical protein
MALGRVHVSAVQFDHPGGAVIPVDPWGDMTEKMATSGALKVTVRIDRRRWSFTSAWFASEEAEALESEKGEQLPAGHNGNRSVG